MQRSIASERGQIALAENALGVHVAGLKRLAKPLHRLGAVAPQGGGAGQTVQRFRRVRMCRTIAARLIFDGPFEKPSRLRVTPLSCANPAQVSHRQQRVRMLVAEDLALKCERLNLLPFGFREISPIAFDDREPVRRLEWSMWRGPRIFRLISSVLRRSFSPSS